MQNSAEVNQSIDKSHTAKFPIDLMIAIKDAKKDQKKLLAIVHELLMQEIGESTDGKNRLNII